MIEVPQKWSWAPPKLSKEELAFWPTYRWEESPWIRDQTGNILKRSKYNRIQPCTLAELHLQGVGIEMYSMVIPTVAEGSIGKTSFVDGGRL